MKKATLIIAKVLSLLVGIIFLAISIFEFLILIRGEASLFEDSTSATWLYLIRGIASLMTFLLSLSLLVFPKSKTHLVNLIASSGILTIVCLSYLLMELYIYITLVLIGLICWIIFLITYISSLKMKDKIS